MSIFSLVFALPHASKYWILLGVSFTAIYMQFPIFICFDVDNNFSIMSGRFQVFLRRTSTEQRIKILAQGHNTVNLPALSLEQQPFNPPSNALPTASLSYIYH